MNINIFILLSCLFIGANCFGESLQEKTVAPKKNVDAKCLELLKPNNITLGERCEFFKCFEERFPCGKQYWIINWGHKYCRRYADQEFLKKFTPKGKALLEHVNKCLPKQFEKFYKTKKPISCKKLNKDAFDAQRKCYTAVQKDFCQAFSENKELFVKVLDYNDLMNLDSISMIQKATEKCSPKIDLLSIAG